MNELVNFVFFGDICLNGEYKKMYSSGANPFTEIKKTVIDSDLVIGNLECLAKGVKGENLLKWPRLETSLETLNYLKNINLGLATLANNHVYDHLEDGFKKTTNFLFSQNIKYIGASLNNNSSADHLIITLNNIKFCILNYVTKDTNPNPPINTSINLNIFELDCVIDDINKYKDNVDYVILTLHWGGRVEGGFFPDWDQPKIARKLIDAGADLIVGHHSHTIQPYEIYKGKYIFYSLGNFCFSDFVFEGEMRRLPARRKRIVLVSVTFELNSYSIEQFYYQNIKGFLREYNFYKYIITYRQILFEIIKHNYIIWRLYYIYQKKFLTYVLYLTNNKIGIKDKMKKVFQKIS